MKYRCMYLPGGTFFFTLVTDQRRKIFSTSETVKCFLQCYEAVRQAHPFESVALVVMPDHLHALWTLHESDTKYSTRRRLIKSGFSRMCSSVAGHGSPIWQNRFWEHLIRDETDLQHHVDYIHFNPVKHELVRAPGEWTYSSIHRYIREGLLPVDWAADVVMHFDKDIGRE